MKEMVLLSLDHSHIGHGWSKHMVLVNSHQVLNGYLSVQRFGGWWKRRYFALQGRTLMLFKTATAKRVNSKIEVKHARRELSIHQGLIIQGTNDEVWNIYVAHGSEELFDRLFELVTPLSRPSQKCPSDKPLYSWLNFHSNLNPETKHGYVMLCNNKLAHFSLNMEGAKAVETGTVAKILPIVGPLEFKLEMQSLSSSYPGRAVTIFAQADTPQETKLWLKALQPI